MVPGNPCIYYGEEIAMAGSGIDENKRSGMVWSSEDETGIPRNPANSTNNRRPEQGVTEQLVDPDSLLNYYRAILELKAKHPDIYDGDVSAVEGLDKGICAIQAGDVIILHNLTDTAISIPVSALEGKTSANNLSLSGSLSPTTEAITLEQNTLTLPPYSTAVLS